MNNEGRVIQCPDGEVQAYWKGMPKKKYRAVLLTDRQFVARLVCARCKKQAPKIERVCKCGCGAFDIEEVMD